MVGLDVPISIEILLAFLGGLVAFVTPCIYPTVLSYFAFTAATSIQNQESSEAGRFVNLFVPSLLFFLGLGLFFTINTFPSVLQEFHVKNYYLLVKMAGAVVIFFGIGFLGVAVKVLPLYSGKKFKLNEAFFGLAGIFLLGTAFGIAWTHCLGPILSSILTVALKAETAYKGLLLIIIYSLGLGVAFLLAGLILGSLLTAFAWLKPYYKTIKDLSGIYLIAIGVSLIVTPWWIRLSKIFISLSSNSFGWRLESLVLGFFK